MTSVSSFIRKYNINKDFVLFTLIVVAVCYLYNDTVYSAKKKVLASKNKAVDSLKKETTELMKAGGNLKEKERNLNKLKKEFQKYEKEQKRLFERFPNKAEASKMLSEIVSEKKFSGITFESFYPSGEIPTENGYYYIPIEVQVSGSYRKMGEYVKYIESLPRIIIIDDIMLQTTKEGEVYNGSTAQLKGKTYVLKY